MEKFKLNKEFILALSLIVVAVASRLLPHPPNFAPITGIALFATSRFDSKLVAVFVPFLAMILTDLVLGFSAITGFVYLAFAAILGIGFIVTKINPGTVILSSIVFFVSTNLGVWFLHYPHTWEAMVSCFVLAIPFYTNTLLGDLFYTALLFYGFSTVKHLYFKPS